MSNKLLKFSIKTLIFFIVLHTYQSVAQYPSLFPKTSDWNNISPLIKKKFVFEATHSKKYDSSYQLDNSTFYSFNKITEQHIKLTLLQYEEDFDEDSVVISTYEILLSYYFSETGHAVKLVETHNFLLEATSNEVYNPEELKSFIKTNGGWQKVNFYNDISPWRNLKSYKRSIEINKLVPLPKLLNPIYNSPSLVPSPTKK